MAKENYLCRMKDYDGDDDWDEVEAWDAEGASEKYAELCHQRSGGEMLCKEDDDATIFVKDKAGAITEWCVSVGYLTVYSASPAKAA